MQKSRSQRVINRQQKINRSISSKCIYINDGPTSSKDIATIFHSPYKNGRKNTDYSNPSFMSSSLFYPTQYVQAGETKHNLQYNRNQKIKQELYQKRIRELDKSDAMKHQFIKPSQTKIKNKKRQRIGDKQNIHLDKSRATVKADKSSKLIKQLESLISYRENACKETKKNDLRTSSQAYPVYIDKNRYKNQMQAQNRNLKNLTKWRQNNEKVNQTRANNQRLEKQKDNQAVEKSIFMNKRYNEQKEFNSRKNAAALAKILKEQIQMFKQRQKHEKSVRVQFS